MKVNKANSTAGRVKNTKSGGAQNGKPEEAKSDKVSLSYYPQGPDILPRSTVEFDGPLKAGPADDRLRVSVPRHFPTAQPDENGNFNYTGDDPNFDSVNTYAVARQTLEMAEKYTARKIPWSFTKSLDREEMIIHPHAGNNTANAFYSREGGSINFFNYTDEGRNVHRTGIHSDVVSHEVGHAVLDAIRPTYITSFSVPSGGYHESFGDMVSMLRALHEPEVLNALKAETKGDLGQSNIATRLAEEFGQSLVGKPFLRDAVNDHKYADQHFLSYTGNPEDGPNGFGTEPHAYANLFTGAFYDLFQKVYDKASADPDLTFHQAVAQARDTMGHLLFRATELAPVGNPAYPEMAMAFLQADIIDNGGENAGEIAEVFAQRNILHPETTEALVASTMGEVPYVKLRKSATEEKGADKFLEDKREKLGLPAGQEFEFVNAYKNDRGETYINYATKRLGKLDDPDFGTNEGSRFEGTGGLTLLFDESGKLKAKTYDPVTDREMNNIKDFIRERSLAGQFVAYDGSMAGHNHVDKCDDGCGHNHSQSLMFTINNDGNGPVLGKAPIVFCDAGQGWNTHQH
ncbi:MAG: M36 family metallopeptidase [Candidatus Eremiobacteraeota bacterium]|nr:M36 family metallopeptidase [Candidatus Eremiobacteraeota bacterium]